MNFKDKDKVILKSGINKEFKGKLGKIVNNSGNYPTLTEGFYLVKWENGFTKRGYVYRESELKLACNKKRNCRACKFRLQCITEGA